MAVLIISCPILSNLVQSLSISWHFCQFLDIFGIFVNFWLFLSISEMFCQFYDSFFMLSQVLFFCVTILSKFTHFPIFLQKIQDPQEEQQQSNSMDCSLTRISRSKIFILSNSKCIVLPTNPMEYSSKWSSSKCKETSLEAVQVSTFYIL